MFCLQLRDEVEAKLRYEDREAVAERVNRAIGSVLCGASRVCEASVNFITEPIFFKMIQLLA